MAPPFTLLAVDPTSSFERWALVLAPGAVRPYDEAEWRDALVVVERGELEVAARCGRRVPFACGAVVWLTGLPVRALCNTGQEATLLVAVARRLACVEDPDVSGLGSLLGRPAPRR